MPQQYPNEVSERAVRMVLDRHDGYPSVWAARQGIAPKLDVGPGSLRKWVVQAETGAGERSVPTSDELEEVRRLKREAKDLREANEILRAASLFREGTRPSPPLIVRFIDQMRDAGHGVESTCDVLLLQGVAVTVRSYRVLCRRPPSNRATEDAAILNAFRRLRH